MYATYTYAIRDGYIHSELADYNCITISTISLTGQVFFKTDSPVKCCSDVISKHVQLSYGAFCDSTKLFVVTIVEI